MTHMSPTVLLFCSICCIADFAYFVWHSWSFDRFQSLLPTKRRAFKCGITWTVLLANACFACWAIGLAYIKYNVGYITVPDIGTVLAPFPTWPEKYQAITPGLYYILTGGWAMLLTIHIEETTFWLHLSSSIRGSTKTTWTSSIHFKIWLLGSACGIATLFSVVIPYRSNPQKMETNGFLAGTCFHFIFTLSSFYIVSKFPKLIETVRKQGGSRVVLNRLAYHRRLTIYRIFARFVFIIPFLLSEVLANPNFLNQLTYTVSIDGLTPHQDVGHNQFLTDLFLIIGLSGLVVATFISIYMFFPPDRVSAEPLLTTALDLEVDAQEQDQDQGEQRETEEYLPNPNPQYQKHPGFFPQFNTGGSDGSGLTKAEKAAAEAKERQREKEERQQIRTQLSVVAPFATPPPSPVGSDIKQEQQDRGIKRLPSLTRGLGNIKIASGGGPLVERGVDQQQRGRAGSPERQRPLPNISGNSSGAASSSSLANSNSNSTPTTTQRGASDVKVTQPGGGGGGSTYAWSLLADHLRLPDNAMGLSMLAQATEMDQRGWRAAQRVTENIMIPKNLRPPRPPRNKHQRLHTPETGMSNTNTDTTDPNTQARSVPIPVSRPKAKPFGMSSILPSPKSSTKLSVPSAPPTSALTNELVDNVNITPHTDMSSGSGHGSGLRNKSRSPSPNKGFFGHEYGNEEDYTSRDRGSRDPFNLPMIETIPMTVSIPAMESSTSPIRSLPPPLRKINISSRSPPTDTPFSAVEHGPGGFLPSPFLNDHRDHEYDERSYR